MKTLFKNVTLLFISLILCFPAMIYGQCKQGIVLENKSMKSKILGDSVKYSVFLPADYQTSTRSYPVLYLLHGYTDNEISWVQFGEVNRIADNAILKGEAAPMVIIMPDAGLSWYVNNYTGKVKYEDMFFNEFIPFIEKAYRIRINKEFRAIGGLSMGGYGALLYAMKHPDMFTACIPLSAGIHTNSETMKTIKENNNSFSYIDVYRPLKNDSLPETWYKNSILNLAATLPAEQLSSVRYYIDCGDKDFLIEGNCALHIVLKDRKIPHEFRVREGEHTWVYWRESIYEGLKFVSQSFNR